MKLKVKLNDKTGFTLVELLLVIVIIVILGVLLIPNILETLDESRVENGKAIEKLLIKNLELYNADHSKDLWNNYNDDYDCTNEITFEDLLAFNPDINLGECLLNKEDSFTIEKVGANKYKYYVGITCGKKLTASETNEYLIDNEKEQDSYYRVENPACNGQVLVTADPNKGEITNLPDGWVRNGDKIQKLYTPGDEFGELPGITSIEGSGYVCNGWNTDKNGGGESINENTKAKFSIRTIYGKCVSSSTIGEITLDPKTIETNYQSTPQTMSLQYQVNNDTVGGYRFTKLDDEKYESQSGQITQGTHYITITGANILIEAAAPVGKYTFTMQVKNSANQTATATYTVIINPSVTYLEIPSSPSPKVYNGSNQQSGITCPTGSQASGDTTKKNVGVYTQTCHITDPEHYKWRDAGFSTNDKNISWEIKKAECPKPAGINVTTGGIITWTAPSVAANYLVKTGNENWNGLENGASILNQLITATGTKTVSVKAQCTDTNYNEESDVTTVSVSVHKITFNSNNANSGTVNPETYNVVKGATYETSNNKILIKGKDANNGDLTLRTITATPKTEHNSFTNWSKQNGTVNSDETVTANFGTKQYTTSLVVVAGQTFEDEEATKSADYDTDITFEMLPNESGAMGIVNCGNGQLGTIGTKTVQQGSNDIEVSVLTVHNISADTTCRVEFSTTQTVLHEDGTLVINEKASNRASEIENHGPIKQKLYNGEMINIAYPKIGAGYNYIFGAADQQLWKNERSLIKQVYFGEPVVGSINTSYWFYGLNNVENINLQGLDTSNVESMTAMFLNAGADVNNKAFRIQGMNSEDTNTWDTSNVTDMSYMFYQTGYGANAFNIGDISNWDTSKVTNMEKMFYFTGTNATSFHLDLSNGTGWNTGIVQNMREMFAGAGRNSNSFSLDLTPDNNSWNTSNVTNMRSMFQEAGFRSSTWSIGDISNWNTSNVTDMTFMFYQANGAEPPIPLADTWTLGINGIGGWDVSKVESTAGMFFQAGRGATTWNIGDLSNWFKTETNPKINNINSMFNSAGYSATTFDIGDLSNWDTSKVTNMTSMFNRAAYLTQTKFNIGNIGKWDVRKVTSTMSMFQDAGYHAKTEWYIGDLSEWETTTQLKYVKEMFNRAGYSVEGTFSIIGTQADAYLNWNVSNVTDMSDIFNQAGHNAATSWKIGNLKNWDTSKVTSMSGMFEQTAYSAPSWSVGDISNWDVSKVQNAHNMFDQVGFLQVSTFNLDLSNWFKAETNPAISDMSSMFNSAGHSASTWTIGNISNWDTSKVTNMSSMFGGIAWNASTINLNLADWNTDLVTNMRNMFHESGSHDTVFNIGTLDIHQANIEGICSSVNINGTLNIYGNPTSYGEAFYNASKLTGTSITVNYSSTTTNIDNIIATKSSGSNVVKAPSPILVN